MTMAKPVSKAHIKAEILTEWWLRGEHGYQFRKNQSVFAADARASQKGIMERELANKWHRFQGFRRQNQTEPHPGLWLQSNQQLLKATAAARAAVIWNGVIVQKTPPEQGNAASFGILKSHFQKINSGRVQLPETELLNAPLAEAISPASVTPIDGRYEPIGVFQSLASLCLTHLLEQQAETGSMALPKPGVPSGDIQPWTR